jgi:YjbE family integral membrane protein
VDWVPVSELVELLEVVFVNLVLSADNAIVVGIAVAGLPVKHRLRVMALGIAGATALRIVFAMFTVQLLEIVGLLLAGGLLLLWICWKLWGELRMGKLSAEAAASDQPKTMMAAVWQIVVADVSMSLDNVLAVAGVAREHLWVLIVGLVLSIAFMGLAAALISRLLNRYPWIAYFGLVVILYVAFKMIWDGLLEVLPVVKTVASWSVYFA